jgi:hypothetical protein
MRSLLVTTVIIFYIVYNVTAQVPLGAPNELPGDPPPTKKSFGERLVFGGGLGAYFGSTTQVNIQPIIGYRITDKLTSGIGINYSFYKTLFLVDTNTILNHAPSYAELAFKDNQWGGSLWSEYRIIPQAFLHAEYGFLNLSYPQYNYNERSIDGIKHTATSFLVGGGYYQAVGNNAGMQISLLWDLVGDKYSPYQNPILRIGFTAGF